MATKKTTTTEIPKQFADTANAYIDRLAKSHERFAEGLETVRARTARVNDKVVESMIAGQRDALTLGKTMAADPSAYAKNIEALVQSFSTAQERALDVAKTVYREQAEAGSELREVAESMFDTNKTFAQPFETFAKPFEKMTSMWMPTAK